MEPTRALIPLERIERAILLVRGQKVMLDWDLARLYQVTTKALNLAVRRNLARFPDDFMFQLTLEDAEPMRSQTVTTSKRNVPYPALKAAGGSSRRFVVGLRSQRHRRSCSL